MPLYEYQCDACGRRFEQIRRFSDPPIDVCPHCGAREVQKLLSSPAIQFKGSGWYITDYARKGSSGAEGGAKADSSTPKTDNPAKSESSDAKSAPENAAAPADTKK
jgi:putative FmdB family regulatory protein